jgi:hypothetical protein
MKNATYADQCDTIRTLTEEEMAVVSGGFNLQALVWRYEHTNYTPSYYYNYNYNSSASLNFLQRVYLDSSGWSNAGCIFGALMN